MFEPEVIAFYTDHGVDIRDQPLASLIATDDEVRVEQTDPLCVAVTYTCRDDQLRLVVDNSLTVQQVDSD